MFKRMREAREFFGLSPKQMAEKCNISVNYYHLIENDKFHGSFTADVLKGFDSLGVNTHWLLTGEGSMLRHDSAEFMIQENMKNLKPEIEIPKRTTKPLTEKEETAIRRWQNEDRAKDLEDEITGNRENWPARHIPQHYPCRRRLSKKEKMILKFTELLDLIMEA